MTICELESEDLSFVFVEFEFFFGSFSGFEFLVVGGAGFSDRGPEAAVGSCGGVDIVGVDVGVEALEEENGDLEEGERESERKTARVDSSMRSFVKRRVNGDIRNERKKKKKKKVKNDGRNHRSNVWQKIRTPHLRPEKASAPPTLTEILTRDQSRVNSIQSRLRQNSLEKDSSNSKATTTIPAKSGPSILSDYIVTVGLGTPKKQLSLVFDTGSTFVWTQCKPCTVVCYKQKQPIFDPAQSTTYKNITCTSRQCSQLSSSTNSPPSCSTNTCAYGIGYGDGSTSYGFFASETFTLTPSDVFPNFLFGCGENNQGKFDGEAGLIGLGRSQLSLVSQISSKYGNYFSYCLPSTSSYTGSLTFGKGGRSSAGSSLQFTPLLSNSKDPSLYYVDIIGIKVGGKTLSISRSVFKTPGSIIDSGTSVSLLPPAAYDALKTAFRQHMTQYRMAKPVSGFDTCYRVKKNRTLKIPSISFVFGGNIEVAFDYSGILIADSSNACLAFIANSNSSDVVIFGNAQQKTLDVVYDVAGGKLGFGYRGCS